LDAFYKNMRYIVANADTFFEGTQREEEQEKLEMGISVRELSPNPGSTTKSFAPFVAFDRMNP
jgi:hypothetical protein